MSLTYDVPKILKTAAKTVSKATVTSSNRCILLYIIKEKMNKAYPIVVILTNKECSHCVRMRGKHGWPSDKLEPFNDAGDRWDLKFFYNLLTGGGSTLERGIKSQQQTRVIEINFEDLTMSSPIHEITFFDLNPKNNKISIKKYSKTDDGRLVKKSLGTDNMIVSNIIAGMSFDRFVQMYVPLEKLRNYIHVFPSFIYVHSTIWEDSLEDSRSGKIGAPLYARVQGFRTVRDGNDYNTFKILKERRPKLEEYRKSPIAVVKKLLYVDLEPLLFPCD